MRNKFITYMFAICALLMASAPAKAEYTNEKFQDVLLTAGYATAIGAALGVALLSFHSSPENHLRYVAVGASLGFIGGTAFGSYIVFSPALVNSNSFDSHNADWAFNEKNSNPNFVPGLNLSIEF